MVKGIILLLVEDDIDDREIFLEAAKEVNHSIKCYTASNGEEALELLQDKNNFLPDFIFLDLNMPVRSGKELLKDIKVDTTLKKLKVIVYTTSFSEAEKNECLKLGADSFITKPRSFEEIRNAIWHVVKKKLERPA